MSADDEVPWERRCSNAAYDFGQQCAALRDSNPYDLVPLDSIMPMLMAELWDRGFSQTEIRRAFARALEQMPRYAAGDERRGDRERRAAEAVRNAE